MEPQDDNTTQFTGTPQSETPAFSEAKTTGKGIKVFAVFSIFLIIALAAGLTFFYMKSDENSKKVDDLQAKIDAKNEELNNLRETAMSEIDFSVFYDAMATAGISEDVYLIATDESFIKTSADDNFQIARFIADEPEGSGWIAFFYRALPDGDWVFSDFSGNGLASCEDLTEEEIAAFDGIVECFAGEDETGEDAE
ncbi:hypothetical protein FWF89_02260 [Candidatus Saccharibacteria bacterium]|nr:hypothetical protein [Candidatus Saccharibacteria bacterium]